MRDRRGLERGHCVSCAERNVECCEYTFPAWPDDDHGEWELDVPPEEYRRRPLLRCAAARLAAGSSPPAPPEEEPMCAGCGCPPASHEAAEVTPTEAHCLAAARDILAPMDLSIVIRQSVHDTTNLGMERDQFLYGEVGDLSFLRMLDRICTHWAAAGAAGRGGVFYDLGCGAGKAVVLAAFHAEAGFRRCVGVELLPGLAAMARGLADRYSSACEGRAEGDTLAEVVVIEEDLFKTSLSGASVVLLNAGSWHEPALSKLRTHILEALPDGCVLATIRKPLVDEGSQELVWLDRLALPMSWGVAPVFLAERRRRRHEPAREQVSALPKPVFDLDAMD